MSDETGSQPSQHPGRVVVVQTAFVGDVVFASPVIHALRQAYPQAHLALMVRPDKAELAACIPGLDQVLTFDKRGRESGLTGLFRAAGKLKRGRFDLLISLHRSARSALLAKLSSIQLRLGFRSGLGGLGYHIAVVPSVHEPCRLFQEFDLLKRIGVEPDGYHLRLKAPADQVEYLEAFNRSKGLQSDAKLVALCIGSLWPTKRWPPVYFSSLAESLKERSYQPVLFGGGEELGIAREIEKLVADPMLSCVGNSLVESAALLSKCQMAVGGDTGLTHMARALGVPTVAIYGPTDQRQHCFDDRSRVLAAKIQCRPCSRHGQNRCPERHHDCVRLVSPERVMDAFREISNLQTPVPRFAHGDADVCKDGDAVPLP